MRERNLFFALMPVLFALVFFACSSARIPTVSDDRLERMVRDEAFRILQVTQDKDAASLYRFLLSDFPRKDIFGLTNGGRRIYVSYELAKRAASHAGYRWQLRQTLAHEIAHELSGHAQRSESALNATGQERGFTGADLGLPADVQFRAYSVEKELEADSNGMKYWSALKWDCRIWVELLEAFAALKYAGDIHHPTDARLSQALRACTAAAANKGNV